MNGCDVFFELEVKLEPFGKQGRWARTSLELDIPVNIAEPQSNTQ